MWKALGIVFGWTMTVLVWAIPPYGIWAALYGTVTDVPASVVPVMRVLQGAGLANFLPQEAQ